MSTNTDKPGKPPREPVASRPNMPEYGLEDAASGGLLPWSWAVERMTRTQNFFLCTVRSDGRPHVMPVWGVWHDGGFYFSTGRNSVKARNLANNPKCIVCPGNADEALILEGSARKVTNKDLLQDVAASYVKKYKMDPLAMKQPIFVVKPALAFGQIEETYTKTATRWTF